MKRIVLRALVLAVFVNGGCMAKGIARETPVLIPAPVRVLGPTQIKDPAALAVPPVPLAITIDVSQVQKDIPEIRKWAENAADVCREWYLIICHELASEDFKPRHAVTFIFVPRLPPGWGAFANRDSITVSVENLTGDFSNYGMMVHELTHIVQAYPGNSGPLGWLLHGNHGVGWLTEGIADYVRFYLYEADPIHGGIRPTQSKYTDSYRSTACFSIILSASTTGKSSGSSIAPCAWAG